ncbi:MAG: sensor histidine kinase [Chloroflexi bacterium]|nr:sensor histidine kinase [Chloroflexota bacterium]
MNIAPSPTTAILVQTQEEERYRLARALQNGPGQLLANAAMEIETCLRLMEQDPSAARQGLAALLLEMRGGLDDLRHLVRELQPPLLNDLGLAASLVKSAADFENRFNISVEVIGWEKLTGRLPASMELGIFRIVHEALDNVAQHARAKRVQIILELGTDSISVTIADDGSGFDLNTYGAGNSERRLGLIAMRDRAEFLGGHLHVYSDIDRGTRVVFIAPFPVHA